MTAYPTSKICHHMERRIEGDTIDRIEIGSGMARRMVMNESEWPNERANRDRRHPPIGAGGDVAKCPGRIE